MILNVILVFLSFSPSSVQVEEAEKKSHIERLRRRDFGPPSNSLFSSFSRHSLFLLAQLFRPLLLSYISMISFSFSFHSSPFFSHLSSSLTTSQPQSLITKIFTARIKKFVSRFSFFFYLPYSPSFSLPHSPHSISFTPSSLILRLSFPPPFLPLPLPSSHSS